MSRRNDQAQQSLALDCARLAEEIARGPAFFDERGMPTEAVARYNGSRVASDPERCALVAAMKLLAFSDRQISTVIGCDVRSIPIMVSEAEKAGRIPALKDRLRVLVGQNAEQSSLALRDLLGETLGGERSLELAAMLKSVGQVNTFLVEKHQLLTGAPTEILETRTGAGRDELEAWAIANAIPISAAVTQAAPAGSAVDYVSAGTGPDRQQTPSSMPARSGGDTYTSADPACATTAAVPNGAAAAAAAAGGGGGSRAPGTPDQTMGLEV
jgi:hypothetical protein